MRLGSNGVDGVRSLQKIPTQLCGTDFCINCTSLAHFAPSLMSLQNIPKCTQTLLNATKHAFRVQQGGPNFVAQTFVAQTFALFAPVWPISRRISCSKKMISNAPKH